MNAAMSLYRTARPVPETDRVYWTLSALLARRHYGPLTLFADDLSAKLLVNDWGLPFDEVDTVTIPRDTRGAHPMCWSAGKLAAMREMARRGKPFFHIDGDAFLFSALAERLTSARMFCQCVEKSIRRRTAIYRRNTHYPINELVPNLQLPKWMTDFYRLPGQKVINMGIFGGTDCASIFEYADIALRVFVGNRHNIAAMQHLNRSRFHFLGIAVIAEQWALGAYCNWKGIEPEAIMNRIDSFNVDRAHEVGNFVHLYTALRKLPHYQAWASHQLQEQSLAKAA